MELKVFIENGGAFSEELKEKIAEFLADAAALMEKAVKDNTPVRSGATKNAWQSVLDKEHHTAVIGNTMKNAVWEEFGTGEYALSGKGRKDGWVYHDENGFHFTYGKPPKRCLFNAFTASRNDVIKLAEKLIAEVDR